MVDKTYNLLFSGEALLKAQDAKDNRKIALLLRACDFASVIEAKRAMSAGDVGRLMSMWKFWSVMIQGIKGLTHYSKILPQVVAMLTKTLPEPITHVLKHNLLIAPSGRPNHFVAKDFFLEVQNYWLKFFYNNAVSLEFVLRCVSKSSKFC